jgi:hypothetical protein
MFDLAQVNVLDSEGDYDTLAGGWGDFKLPDIMPPRQNPTIYSTGFPSQFPSTKQQLITFGIGSGSTLLSALAAKISGGLVGPSPENLQILFGQNRYGLNPTVNQGVVGGPVSDIGATAGGALGNLGDSLGQIVYQHPYLTIGAGFALVLLFMPSPSRGRR